MSATELIISLEEDKISLLDGSHLLLDFSHDELRKLQNALMLSSSLESIELENIRISEPLWQLLGEALAFNNSVKSFKLSNTLMRDDDIEALEKIIFLHKKKFLY